MVGVTQVKFLVSRRELIHSCSIQRSIIGLLRLYHTLHWDHLLLLTILWLHGGIRIIRIGALHHHLLVCDHLTTHLRVLLDHWKRGAGANLHRS